jgi:hypothetical protein
MHFSTFLLLGTLIAVVVGLPLNTRNVATKDGDALLSVLNRIGTGITRVDAEVKLWLSDIDGGMRILEGARWVHQDMSTGAQFIENLPNNTINTVDALKIIGPMTNIMKMTDSYTRGLVEKKADFDKLSLTTQILLSLHDSRVAAEALAKAIQKKLPGTLSWSVMPTVDVIIGTLDRTAQAFGAIPGPYIPQNLLPPQAPPIQPSPPIDEILV